MRWSHEGTSESIKEDEKRRFMAYRLPEIDEKLRSVIESNFDNPVTYFSVEGMILNKVIQGPKKDRNKKIVPYSFVGGPEIFEKKQNFQVRNTESQMALSRAFSRRDDSHRRATMKKTNVMHINNQFIDNLYSKYNRRNQENDVNDFCLGLPEDIKINLIHQQKYLNRHENYKQEVDKIAKKIKSNVKNKRRLLLNEEHDYPHNAFLTEANQRYRNAFNQHRERKLGLQVTGLSLLKSEFERVKSSKGPKLMLVEDKKPDQQNEFISFRYDSGKSRQGLNEISILKSLQTDSSVNKSIKVNKKESKYSNPQC